MSTPTLAAIAVDSVGIFVLLLAIVLLNHEDVRRKGKHRK